MITKKIIVITKELEIIELNNNIDTIMCIITKKYYNIIKFFQQICNLVLLQHKQ